MTIPKLIIDGYNVIHALPELSAQAARGLEDARLALLRRLLPYVTSHKVEMVVVFDGAEVHPADRREQELPHLRVLFSHPPESADAVIEKLLLSENQPRRLTLVSEDKRLVRVARGQGASALSPARLFCRIERTKTMGELMESKYNGEMSEAELAEWLALFGEGQGHGRTP